MNPNAKSAVISLIAVFAVIGLVAALTNAQKALTEMNVFFFIGASIFFMGSVIIWIISWAYLIKKHATIPYSKLIAVGLGAVYGALTPVQLGAEALRSIKLKELHGVSYLDSVAASMIAKGTKFSIFGIIALVVFALFFVDLRMQPLLVFAFFSGISVIALAVFLFLAPLKRSFGSRISKFFSLLSRRIGFFSKVSAFFDRYSLYLERTSKRWFVVVFALVFASWILEFLALYFSFRAMWVPISLHSALIFMVLVSILERTPFLPRGIGVVELVGYHFLAFPELVAGSTMSLGQIGGVLVVYGVVRLVVPTLISAGVSIACLRGQKTGMAALRKKRQRFEFTNKK